MIKLIISKIDTISVWPFWKKTLNLFQIGAYLGPCLAVNYFCKKAHFYMFDTLREKYPNADFFLARIFLYSN